MRVAQTACFQHRSSHGILYRGELLESRKPIPISLLERCAGGVSKICHLHYVYYVL